jgi:hypothetical protein
VGDDASLISADERAEERFLARENQADELCVRAETIGLPAGGLGGGRLRHRERLGYNPEPF